MTTPPFARRPPRILTDADGVTLPKELKHRLAELDRSEVELRSVEEVWQSVFGHEAPPGLKSRSR
ncbi:hypothetical protein OV203_40890 [Nannocystis sp. ILAH1]|uniref:hypothetical protein n=1 Tax=unclassified Nannocystis TaxID=2627009 RepID=UPI00226F11E2|nr:MULTISPECIES: hypothetical protein [unclassified Nannocystis]MCY0993566.1 hypothetical protein [Nannocystis sp. ILAH1]MCY1063707.1 hypothetical protein [Nannocystis sp. RBIL2]